MSTIHSSIDQHPDLLALRAGYERTSQSASCQAVFGLTLIAGVFAATAPWIVGFDATTRLTVNDLIVGLTVGVLAIKFGSALERTHGLIWTLPVAGVWLIISPWIVRDVSPDAGMIWSNVVIGAVVTILGLVASYLGSARNLSLR